jgi:hypothetical protein
MKYWAKVPWPSKTVRVTNPKAKMTVKQCGFANRMVSVTSRALNVKNKGLKK